MRNMLWIVLTLGFVLTTATWVLPGSPPTEPGQNGQSQQAQPATQAQPSSQSAKPAQGQAGQQGAQPAAPAHQVTQDEVNAIKAIQSELDPDRTIQLVQDFEKKYPDSPYLSDIYFYAVNACQQKNQIDKAIDYGEKSLKLKPDNLRSLIALSDLLPLPQDLQNSSDADKEKKLSEAETDANRALQLTAQLQKQPNQTDDQLAKAKSAVASEVHSDLGMVHLQRAMAGLAGPDAAELGKAEAEYKLAVAGENPAPQTYYRLGEVYEHENKLDDAIGAFTKASQLSQGTALQQYADTKVQELNKKKSQPAAPASSSPAPK